LIESRIGDEVLACESLRVDRRQLLQRLLFDAERIRHPAHADVIAEAVVEPVVAKLTGTDGVQREVLVEIRFDDAIQRGRFRVGRAQGGGQLRRFLFGSCRRLRCEIARRQCQRGDQQWQPEVVSPHAPGLQR
jgi:hypothetical protein